MSLSTSPLAVLLVSFVLVVADLQKGQVLDMSYDFDEDTLFWPGSRSFDLTILSRGPVDGLDW